MQKPGGQADSHKGKPVAFLCRKGKGDCATLRRRSSGQGEDTSTSIGGGVFLLAGYMIYKRQPQESPT